MGSLVGHGPGWSLKMQGEDAVHSINEDHTAMDLGTMDQVVAEASPADHQGRYNFPLDAMMKKDKIVNIP